MALPPLILIIDDEADFREIFSTRLLAAGMRVETAENGTQGIEKTKALKPNLVLLDMMMPDMTGADALLKLKDDPETKDIKIVFLSNIGGTQPEAKEVNDKFAQGSGAAGYLRKTDDYDVIVNGVKGFLQ